MVDVTRVPYVYGGFYHVASADLANPAKTYLPLYTRHSEKWEDTAAGQRAARRHQATTLHRENIGKETDQTAKLLGERDRLIARNAVTPAKRNETRIWNINLQLASARED